MKYLVTVTKSTTFEIDVELPRENPEEVANDTILAQAEELDGEGTWRIDSIDMM